MLHRLKLLSTPEIEMTYLELFSHFLNDFLAFLFLFLQSLLFSLKQFLIAPFSILQTFTRIDRMKNSLSLVTCHWLCDAHKGRLLDKIKIREQKGVRQKLILISAIFDDAKMGRKKKDRKVYIDLVNKKQR